MLRAFFEVANEWRCMQVISHKRFLPFQHFFSCLLYHMMHQSVHFNQRQVQFGRWSVLNTVRQLCCYFYFIFLKNVVGFIMHLHFEFVTDAGWFFFFFGLFFQRLGKQTVPSVGLRTLHQNVDLLNKRDAFWAVTQFTWVSAVGQDCIKRFYHDDLTSKC